MKDAELYIRTNQLQYKEAKVFLDLCSAGRYMTFGNAERILDVGCGPGDITSGLLLPLLPADSQLVGLDLSEDMIAHADKTYASERVSFSRADIEDPYLISKVNCGLFDKIFSFHCLQWINNLRQAFQNLQCLVKPGGCLYLVFIATSKLNDINDKLLRHPRWNRHLKVLDERSPKLRIEGNMEHYFWTLLKDFNFSPLECSLVESKHTFRNIQHLTDLVKALHPAVNHMTPEEMEHFLADIMNISLTEQLAFADNSTGQITTSYQIFRIIAQKQS